MTIERRTIVDQIEVPTSGGIFVRLALQLVEAGNVISSRWHRTSIPENILPAEQMAYVNAHLASMGEATVATADLQRLGLFHRLSVEMPSVNKPELTLDEEVAAIKAATESTVVSA